METGHLGIWQKKKKGLKPADKFLDLGLKTNNIIVAMLLQKAIYPLTEFPGFPDYLLLTNT